MKKIINLLSILVIFISSFFISGTFAQENTAFQENDVTFAHITDIHIWDILDKFTKKPTYPEYILKAAISYINKENVDFTLITGDIVDAPNEDLFAHVVNDFNLLDKPWYFAMGNHDCSWPFRYPKDPLIRVIKNANPDFVPNGRYYAFQPKKGFTFIALDGGSGYIDEDQMNFMSKTIRNNPSDVIVIFLHTPIMPPFYCEWHDLAQKDELLEYFRQFKQPIAIIAGHYHGTKIIQDGNILHVASPSLRYSQEYRIINIQNKKDKVIFDFKYRKVRVDKEIYNGADYGRYPGAPSDRNTTITIMK